MTNKNILLSNEKILKAIQGKVKQFENIKDENEYRDKCIGLVYHMFPTTNKRQAEVLFDLAMYNEGVYMTDTYEPCIEFDISFDDDLGHFECRLHDNINDSKNYRTSYNFGGDVPIIKILKSLDKIAQAMEDLYNDVDDEKLDKYLPLF